MKTVIELIAIMATLIALGYWLRYDDLRDDIEEDTERDHTEASPALSEGGLPEDHQP